MPIELNENACAVCGGTCTGKCWKNKIAKGFLLIAIAGSLFLIALFASELKTFYFIGKNFPSEALTISVEGVGKSVAIPDVASISFSVTHEEKTSLEAKAKVTEKYATLQKFLEENGVAANDIKTIGFNVYPSYEWKEPRGSGCTDYDCAIIPIGKKVLLGYEAKQFVDVKIRTINNAAAILGGLIDNGATDVSGLVFSVENEEAFKADAHAKAIAQAKEKAAKLEKELGVSIVKISSFYENVDYPTYDRRDDDYSSYAEDEGYDQSSSANFPSGENTYTSMVTISYEVE